MFMKPSYAIDDFDYPLLPAQIAFTPAVGRSASKLLVWDGEIQAESTYAHIANFIPANATLFFNNSKVIAARILFEKFNSAADSKQSAIEIFCLEPSEKYTPVLLAMQAKEKVEWICLVGGAKKWKEAILTKEIIINQKTVLISARKIKQEAGKFTIEFSWNATELVFSEILNNVGQIPLPPYIQRSANEEDKDRYQTTYAVEEGSVAAPTAGLHFNQQIFDRLQQKGIHQQFVTLHVGAGTFMPVKAATIDAHDMHAEFIEVNLDIIEDLFYKICEIKNPIIAVGTTSLRTLETLYWLGVKAIVYDQQKNKVIQLSDLHLAQWEAYELLDLSIPVQDALKTLINLLHTHHCTRLITKTQLIITPSYSFKICDALVTNFHQPKSTLLLLIAAITGDKWREIYMHALDNQYRFLSYGDGCLFWIKQQVK